MSPKINRSGVSYDENDPRYVPAQRDEADSHVTVTRAQDFEAARAGLPRADEVEQAHDDAVEEYLAGDDREERSRRDYGSWTKAQLNEELDRRKIPHDPKASNPALVEVLEGSDAGRANEGGVPSPSGS